MKGRALFGGLKEENCMFWRVCLYILGNFSWIFVSFYVIFRICGFA